jgi:hypothetical protein
MFGPRQRLEDGTYVFASPIGQGHVPMIALEDIGFFARYTFDNRKLTSGQDLEVASDMVDWDYLVSTFTKVTGQKAIFVNKTFDEWASGLGDTKQPVANERPWGDGSTTWEQNFRCWWNIFHDDVVKRDMAWIRKVNPDGYTLEKWMRENKYTGQFDPQLLKNVEDGKSPKPVNA